MWTDPGRHIRAKATLPSNLSAMATTQEPGKEASLHDLRLMVLSTLELDPSPPFPFPPSLPLPTHFSRLQSVTLARGWGLEGGGERACLFGHPINSESQPA